ncbi:glycoside hydrolase superfamily [Catenaria anguillulae PL171]|uniref:Glycoside hydrolase superfamily n=1 Tax=Catenaria anguillulae PL171 TaxID=765915 RepID=A0A1Y2HQC9_9FUNG|nr:glycoside hydrolase superfamily [Catenaria anguillulae PL171]
MNVGPGAAALLDPTAVATNPPSSPNPNASATTTTTTTTTTTSTPSLTDAWRATGWQPDTQVDPRLVLIAASFAPDLLSGLRHIESHLPYANFVVDDSMAQSQSQSQSQGEDRFYWHRNQPKIPLYLSFVQCADDSPTDIHIATNFSSYLHATHAPYEVTLTYRHPIHAFRALGHVLAATCSSTGSMPTLANLTENAAFDRMSLMLDCSRGGVPNLATIKTFLANMALTGINTLLLYCEDTYEIAGEPYWGHYRGRYTQADLRPWMHVLQWPAYAHVRDTSEVVLVHARDTYELLAKAIRTISAPFRSNRVHVGMDECQGLGEGRHRQVFGEEAGNMSKAQIFVDHLRAVVEICRSLGKEPLVWSDMLFCLTQDSGTVSLQNYYTSPTALCPLISTATSPTTESPPAPIESVFWSYYSTSPAHYIERIQVHTRDLGSPPWVATGIWTWNRLWAALPFTFQVTQAAMAAARAPGSGVRNVMTTVWGDDGNECDWWSVWPALVYYGHCGYKKEGEEVVDPPHNEVTSWFAGVFGGKLEDWLHASRIDNPSLALAPDAIAPQFPPNLGKWLLWEDPAYGHLSAHAPGPLPLLASTYASIHAALTLATSPATIRPTRSTGTCNCHAFMHSCFVGMWKIHRSVWMRRFSVFGWEVLDLRYGGLRARLETTQWRVGELVSALGEMSQVRSDGGGEEMEGLPDWVDVEEGGGGSKRRKGVDRLEELEVPSLEVWLGAGEQVVVEYARACTPMRALGTG